MALTRNTDFTGRGALAEVDPEFNNFRDYINNRLLSNPLTSDLDFGSQFTVDNLRKFWEIRNGAEYGGFTGASIQAAINDLPSTGGWVLLPPGTYTLSQTLNLRTGVKLQGYGMGVTILQRTSGTFTATDTSLIRCPSFNDCAILDLQIDGQLVSNSGSSGLIGVRVSGSTSRFYLERCWIRRFGDSAESVNNANDGVYIDSTGRGFWVQNNLFEDFRRNAVSVVEGDRFFVNDNEMTITAGTAGGDFSNTAVDVEPFGARNSLRGQINGNIIRGWAGLGIVVFNAATTSVDENHGKITVKDNEISDIGRRGILVQLMRNVKVQGNTLDLTTQLAAGATGTLHILNCEDVDVSGNQIYRTGVGAVNADGIMIQGDGSTQRCANIQVMNNIVDNTSRYSVHVNVINTGTVKDVTISENRTRFGGNGVASAEIEILETSGTISDLTIEGNRCTLDGQSATGVHHGIDFASAISNVVMVGNNLVGSTAGGGSAINGRANVTNLEEGHNLES